MSEPRDWAAEAREVVAGWRAEDSTHEDKHADCMALYIESALRAAYASGRMSGLEEAAAMCERDILGGYGYGAARDIRALAGAPPREEKRDE